MLPLRHRKQVYLFVGAAGASQFVNTSSWLVKVAMGIEGEGEALAGIGFMVGQVQEGSDKEG